LLQHLLCDTGLPGAPLHRAKKKPPVPGGIQDRRRGLSRSVGWWGDRDTPGKTTAPAYSAARLKRVGRLLGGPS